MKCYSMLSMHQRLLYLCLHISMPFTNIDANFSIDKRALHADLAETKGKRDSFISLSPPKERTGYRGRAKML